MPDENQRLARAALTALSSAIPLADSPTRTDLAGVWACLAPHHPAVDPARLLDEAAAQGWRLLIPGDPGWPSALDDALVGPVGLWARGGTGPPVAARRCVTVVGGLVASAHAERVTGDLVGDLTSPTVDPVTVASTGLGSGVDVTALRVAAAHRRAVAVLSSTRGLTRLHQAHLDRVADGGMVLCLAPPGVLPTVGHAHARVRLLAALSAATVLVESEARGAAFDTARAAQTLGRPVLVIAGPATPALGAGPRALLAEYAAWPVTGADDVRAVLDQT
ncbi:SMF family protein [Frankia sp. R43]|uniref:DNA-processing protein DprA n=1 Tax=Frankia sp. R43 TaxID=269536 RepID=UPI0006CA2042|nr:DNA-processing protein DprA [Frankia sp. R43]KPM50297.1 SMF family protein [Frankia sp. R43]